MKQIYLEKLRDAVVNRSFLTSRSQAKLRGQDWLLEREEFIELWINNDNWAMRGRGIDDLTLTRIDMDGAWEISNVEIVTRKEMLKREALYRKGKKICK